MSKTLTFNGPIIGPFLFGSSHNLYQTAPSKPTPLFLAYSVNALEFNTQHPGFIFEARKDIAMTLERRGIFSFAGEDQTIIGPDINKGQIAPDFVAIAQNWDERNPLEETAGKIRILAAVASLDTSVCDRETRRFNEEAAGLGEDVHVFIISADLPFAQKRWCGANGVDRVETLSDHLHTDFGVKYGCLVKEKRILRRAAFVIDREGKVTYVEYLPVLGEEPDYEAVLQAARQAL